MCTHILPAWHVALTKVTSAALPDSNFTEDCLRMQILALNTLSATLCNKLEMKNDGPCWLDLQEKWKQQTNKQTNKPNPEGYIKPRYKVEWYITPVLEGPHVYQLCLTIDCFTASFEKYFEIKFV